MSRTERNTSCFTPAWLCRHDAALGVIMAGILLQILARLTVIIVAFMRGVGELESGGGIDALVAKMTASNLPWLPFLFAALWGVVVRGQWRALATPEEASHSYRFPRLIARASAVVAWIVMLAVSALHLRSPRGADMMDVVVALALAPSIALFLLWQFIVAMRIDQKVFAFQTIAILVLYLFAVLVDVPSRLIARYGDGSDVRENIFLAFAVYLTCGAWWFALNRVFRRILRHTAARLEKRRAEQPAEQAPDGGDGG